jgi:hypothetical protein
MGVFIMELKHECFRDYINPVFFETGSYAGDGIAAAIEAGFESIMSMEVNPPNYNECCDRFMNNDNVYLFLGDSCKDLWDIISHIKCNITFWLDAHYSGEGSPKGLVKYPLLYELNQIRQHPIKTHTIIIDDMRCWRGFNPDRDHDDLNIIDTIMAINPDYKIRYVDGTEKDDVLIAYV